MKRSNILAAAVSAVALWSASPALAQTGTVVVVTSFSKDVTDPFKAAFEQANPGMTLDVQNRNTNAGVKYLAETRSNPQADVFWASAPDAFELLKNDKLLAQHELKTQGLPEVVGGYPVNDSDGYYFGFAASGYGIMWNTRYVEANELKAPTEWEDLAAPAYYDHVAIASPASSGTTHLTLEAILQAKGWDEGWATIKAFSGNLQTITERSFGVPEAVNSGSVGLGIVIDFFAFSAKAAGFPVDFAYPTETSIVPANVAIVAGGPNSEGAGTFIDFLVSPQGQKVLLEPGIQRLPIDPAAYADAPKGYPNPFTEERFSQMPRFDVKKAGGRTAVVDTLFGQLISFKLDDLKAVTRALHDVETTLAETPNAEAQAKLDEARAVISAMPITEAEATSSETAAAFEGGGEGPRQAQIEQRWAQYASENYARAMTLAQEAAALAN